MKNKRLSRSKALNFPKVVEGGGKANTALDLFAAKEAFAAARGSKFDPEKEMARAEAKDAEWERVCKIPEASSDLIVMTKTKKLGAYIAAITQKSPARFRSAFANRMLNLCLDALQDMLCANLIRQDCEENRKRRENHQADAIVKLKMLGYIALLAENAGCILTRQFKQLSVQLADAISLTAAWRKSDGEKWKEKQTQ